MTKICGRPVLEGGVQETYGGDRICGYKRLGGKQRCVWHWLLAQPIDAQVTYAQRRLAACNVEQGEHRARVPADEWPTGERWCAGCQSFVPLFYCTGSRCRACASSASHGQRIQKVYGISSQDYDRLLRWQGGVCYICGRAPRTKRLAVDHNHTTGAVRGLLCANNEHGCNRGVVANLEAAVDGGLAAARRTVAYLERSPMERMEAGEAAPEPPVKPLGGAAAIREALGGPPVQEPPF